MRISGIHVRHLLLLVLMPTFLCGCWDRTETNDLAFVLTSSIDVEKDGKIRVAYLMALPGQMGGASGGGGGTSGGESYYIDSEVGSNVREATNRLQKRTPRRIFLAHRRTVIIGEEFAKKGISNLFDIIPRLPESRLNTFVVITKGNGYNLLNTHPKFERFPAEAIRELAKPPLIMPMSLTMKEVGLALSSGGDPIIPYMETTKSQKGKSSSKEIELVGLAQFQGDKMVGIYKDDTALGVAWLNDKFQNSMVTFPMEDGKTISIRITEGSRHITPTVRNGQVSFDINVELTGKVREDFSGQDFNEPTVVHKVERKLAAFAKRKIESAIKQMQEKGTDSARLGELVWHHYPIDWKQGIEDHWQDLFKKATFVIKSEATITESGLINENLIKEGMKR
jgi:spore germination protein KC